MHSLRSAILLALMLGTVVTARAADGNRLTFLDGSDPYYVSRSFPRLTTPQWIGEADVEAVVILAIDDMREHAKYETFLRPILNRLTKIDGRAPVSIMTNRIDADQAHLQTWLKEGVSLETHTFDHPCPLLAGGDFAKAKSTYDRCVDLLGSVPSSKPVAFRMPCCDSINSPSPRFYAEIFNQTTARGNFLTIDTSVFNVFTANDSRLPRDLVLDPDGREKFRKYLPADRSFVNVIEDYPYPYVIGRLCWQFPCVTPSDWQAQHHHKANASPLLMRDWKAALDATVIKKGVFPLVFHPHGWCKSEQIVELIDHAVSQHGKKVKFLTFHEAQERLDKNFLHGQPLRTADGRDNGVRLLDVNNDGLVDVVIGNDKVKKTYISALVPVETDFPTAIVTGEGKDAGVRFGVFRGDGNAACLVRNEKTAGGWQFDGARWVKDESLLSGLDLDGQPIFTSRQGRDQGVRLRDLDNDGRCELIVGNDKQQAAFTWSPKPGPQGAGTWQKLPFTLPSGTSIVTADGKDAGLRFVDMDDHGHADVIFSNEDRYSLHLFTSMTAGWSKQVLAGQRKDTTVKHKPLPLIANAGTNAGAWFSARHMWVQNEHTNLLKDHVDRRSFGELLADVEPTARSPEASLKSIQARPGFTVELAAAEPLTTSPIAFAWGPDGKFWVVEMGDYPLGVDGKGKPGGRVRYLEDTNGDGKYTKSTVFLDGLPFPTGVMPWRKGVIVTCAPDIFYAEDTKGTGKADLRVPLYSGFREGNQQHRVNSLVWGLDNWIYCANGDSDGTVRSHKKETTVNISGRDFRIRPDEGVIDLQTGRTQYGRSRDDWNNWFGNNNSNPMWHFVLADHYVRRNPHIAAPTPRVNVSVVPGVSRVYPISRTLPRFNSPEAANQFTSACSAIVYRDELFGPAFANNTFVSEPVHNLVHREVMTADGITFTSRRALDEQQSEFLASTDNWFRPAMIQTGPDGALWVADMYRAVIEHPEWIPKDWQLKLDLRAGHDKGRIYRVFPVGSKPRAIPRLDKLDTAGLVAALDSPSGWQRDMAQMMLLWRQDKGAVPLLEKMAAESKRPLARVHALYTLDGLRALRSDVVKRALADEHAGVRRHAIQLCESACATAHDPTRAPELGTALVKLVEDAEPMVRLQLAYTLGEWDDPKAAQALGQLAVKDRSDRFIAAAVMSSVSARNLDAVLLAVMADRSQGPPSPTLLENLLRLANALKHTKALATLVNTVATPDKGRFADWQYNTLAALLDSLDQRNTPLATLRNDADAETRAALQRLEGLFAAARKSVTDSKAERAEQLVAVRLLGRGFDRQQEDVALLVGLLTPQTANDLQAAAVSALGQLRDPKVPEALLRAWKGYGPARRAQVLDTLFRRNEWVSIALDAMQRKELLASELDAPQRQRLLQHKDPAIRQQAQKVLADLLDPDRQKVVSAYQPVLSLKGDAVRGAQVYAKHCANCHKLGNAGHVVGPDLASVGDKSPQGLLIAILDPNRVVESRYVNYLVTTKNGLTLTGILASETGNSITLLGPEGKQQVILRSDLDELISTGKSLMPDGVEKEINHQDMADLIAHVRSAPPPAKPMK